MSRHNRRNKTRHVQYTPTIVLPPEPTAEELIEDLREDNLLFAVQELGFMMPWQLKNWSRFFMSRDSYLTAFDGWLKAQIERPGHVRIIDDVDRKLMKLGPNPDFEPRGNSESNDNPWHGWGRSHEDWDDARYGGYTGSRYVAPTLPLTPTIEAPSGLCGEHHLVV